MKKPFVSILLMLIAYTASTQIILFPSKDTKLRLEYEKSRTALIGENWDIVPLPGEQPQGITAADRSTAATNWGRDLLLPDSLKNRIKLECTKPVLIKIYDTAGKSNHVALKQGQLLGSIYTGEADGEDGNGHGTHVAGIIAGDGDLGLLDALVDNGIVRWKPVKVLSNSGSGSFSWIAKGIVDEGVENKKLRAAGVYVVSTASLGGGTSKIAEVEAALKSDVANGVVWTVAAGNSGGGPVNYPGNSEHVICVGSLDNKRPLVHSSFESVGPEMWVGMPGAGIYSTYKGNTYATLSGTSMATPFQAAACAIALSKWGDKLADNAKMRAYLSVICSDLGTTGKDNFTGWGISYINAILNTDPAKIGTPPPPPPPDTTPIAHPARNLTFDLRGSYQIWWNNNIGMSSQPAKTFVLPSKQLKLLATDPLIVTRIEVSVPGSTNLAPVEYNNVVKNTASFFLNRGMTISGTVDFNDAAIWAAYFYEMILATQYTPKIYCDVVRLEVKDKNGKTSVLNYADLRHWKNTP